MRATNTRTEYGVVTRVLHWVVAVLMLALIALGAWMVGLSYYDRWHHDALELHKALGMIALVLGASKALWYVANEKVRLAGGMGLVERAAARTVHASFLLLMVVIPCSGYLVSTSAGDGVSLFGLLEVPALGLRDDALRDAAIAVHYYTALRRGRCYFSSSRGISSTRLHGRVR